MVLYDITILYGDSYVTLGTVIRDIYREAGILVEDLETDLEWFAKSPKLKEYAVTISDNFGQVTLDFTIKDKEIDPKKFYIRYGSTGKREDLAKWIRKSVTKQYYREGMEILRELEQEGY